MAQKFYVCEHCGNIVTKVKDVGVPVVCCGQKMTELVPGTTDASQEKHVPVYKVEGNNVLVTIGSVEHPMTPEHFIEWIYLQTKRGGQFVRLDPNGEPRATFGVSAEEPADEPIAVYSYCNKHGLWKVDL